MIFFLFTDATNISDGFGNLQFKRPQIGKPQAGFKVTIEQSCLELSNFRLFQKGAVVNQNKVNYNLGLVVAGTSARNVNFSIFYHDKVTISTQTIKKLFLFFFPHRRTGEFETNSYFYNCLLC